MVRGGASTSSELLTHLGTIVRAAPLHSVLPVTTLMRYQIHTDGRARCQTIDSGRFSSLCGSRRHNSGAVAPRLLCKQHCPLCTPGASWLLWWSRSGNVHINVFIYDIGPTTHDSSTSGVPCAEIRRARFAMLMLDVFGNDWYSRFVQKARNGYDRAQSVQDGDALRISLWSCFRICFILYSLTCQS